MIRQIYIFLFLLASTDFIYIYILQRETLDSSLDCMIIHLQTLLRSGMPRTIVHNSKMDLQAFCSLLACSTRKGRRERSCHSSWPSLLRKARPKSANFFRSALTQMGQVCSRCRIALYAIQQRCKILFMEKELSSVLVS